MKPIKFRINNYKSIRDSKECFFEDDYTILAGKNESGKTSILEALRDFGYQSEISEEVLPINDGGVEPKVTVWFEVSKELLEQIYSNLSDDISVKNIRKTNIIEISKNFASNNYECSSDFTVIIGQPFEYYCKIYLKSNLAELSEILPAFAAELKEQPYDQWNEFIDERFDVPNNRLKQCVNGVEQWIGIAPNHINLLKNILKILENYEEKEEITDFIYDTLIKKCMPSFILYSSFDDCFPDEIPVNQIEKNRFAKDLEKISNFRIEAIVNSNKQAQSNHQGKINSEFTEIFKKYWGQSDITLRVEKDGESIYFWIYENDTPYKPSQRSQGQQWFLSFYVKVVARMRENLPNVILIDEPGLFLHAKAQKDMLKTLEEQFKSNIIIFSTHSPYLIDENKLNHVRLIEKEEGFTTIHSKTWARIQDKETLTPILTAIGLGLGDGIENRNNKNNVICEGIEDVFYLRAFKIILKNNSDLNFINGDGANKIHFISRILEAWQCNVRYLFDNDTAGKRGRRKLIDRELIDEKNVLFVSENCDYCTVDLLSKEDFKKYVLEDTDVDFSTNNSAYIADNKLEKPLLARKFLNKAPKVMLDIESINEINGLFEKLKI